MIVDVSKLSTAELLALDPERQEAFLREISEDEGAAARLEYDWDFWARPNQKIPQGEDWSIWALVGGRGIGKTRTGAEFTRWAKDRYPMGVLVARTAAELRDVMIEGESGILATSPPWDRPKYTKQPHALTWANGARALLRSADAPESLRGLNSYWFWGDEAASWKMSPPKPGEPQALVREPDAWSNLLLGWRLGQRPVGCLTTTPRPHKWLRKLLAQADVRVSRGSTYENLRNLAVQFQRNVIARYIGTRLGRQEIFGEVLEDIEGALWTLEMFDQHRREAVLRRDLARVVVAIDPAGSHKPGSDDTGIVAAGLGHDWRGYLLDDWTCHLSPEGWARRALELYEKWGADCIVAERNFGGEMVAAIIRNAAPLVPVKTVVAKHGKHMRAEPISMLYEQGRISHVGATDAFGVNPFDKLEEQAREMTRNGFMGEGSPDNLDAMVWAFTELFHGEQPQEWLETFVDDPGAISPI